ncbi:S41 family peptidase [Olivibacter ginsenosidimutans]|uniref:S41 family peptidase n=1 Tax=Olivibacter ginsenosidimutans TaxID=1176537 RepID=A0ABP9AMK2_9SPHI
MKRIIIFLSFGLLLTGFTIVKQDLFELGKNLEIFAALYRQVSQHYVEPVDAGALMKTGIDAMLEELDPYTEFIPETSLEDFRLKYVNTQYGGLGARILAKANGEIVIAEIFEGFAAHKAGLHVGDQILAIDGRPVQGKEADEVSRLLKGEEGSRVQLRINDSKTATIKEVSVVRDNIIQPNVSYANRLPHGIGYIKLDKFLNGAADEVHQALTDLREQGALNGLILDLRNNGGGILQESVKIINLFVNQGEKVVVQQGKEQDNVFTYFTSRQSLLPNLPLVVLINGNSASASEIVAGALQDLDRAIILGERSFGKGLVQQTYRLPYNNMLKVTVAKYYTPSGRCIQALDYAHKDKDGKAIKVNDSLMAEFTTRVGRKVYDGNGVFPDIEVAAKKQPAVLQALVKQFLLADYATQYYNHHENIPAPGLFRLTDADYADFLTFLKMKQFTYSSRSEKLMRHLKTSIEEEGLSVNLKDELTSLENKLLANDDQILLSAKAEVKMQLEKEIVSRYYFQKGKFTYAEKRDKDILKAQDILQPEHKLAYQEVLSGKGRYGIIGKPGVHLASSE